MLKTRISWVDTNGKEKNILWNIIILAVLPNSAPLHWTAPHNDFSELKSFFFFSTFYFLIFSWNSINQHLWSLVQHQGQSSIAIKLHPYHVMYYRL